MVLAVSNLVDNAIRYSTGTRQLTIAAHASNGAVVLEVSDAGIGIPDDEIQHVTRKFFRGNGAISGGSGLGLSIAQRIVSDHAGSLSIRAGPRAARRHAAGKEWPRVVPALAGRS
jgi:signal transduction histidine kinase